MTSEPNSTPQTPRKQLKADQPLTLEDRQTQAQADLDRFSRLAATPSLSARAAAEARVLARGAQARLDLLAKAIDWRDSPEAKERTEANERTLAIYRLLQIPPPTLPDGTPSTSASGATSAPKTSPPSNNSSPQ